MLCFGMEQGREGEEQAQERKALIMDSAEVR